MHLAAPSSVLTFDSDAVSRVGGIWAGVERTNLAQVEVKRGEVQVGSFGIRLGGTWESYWSKGSVARGVMKVSGGAVTAGGRSLVSNGGLVLGADGRGEISIVGSRSEARFASLVMSNSVESVARFVFDKITGATGRCAGTSVVYTGRGVRLRIPCGTVVLLR